jgi:hypothetical protein
MIEGEEMLTAWEKVKQVTIASARVWNAASNMIAADRDFWEARSQGVHSAIRHGAK